MLQKKYICKSVMPFLHSHSFLILSVGKDLVGQMSALLVSIAAGILVTAIPVPPKKETTELKILIASSIPRVRPGTAAVLKALLPQAWREAKRLSLRELHVDMR